MPSQNQAKHKSTSPSTSLVPVLETCPLCSGKGKTIPKPKLSPYRQRLVHELVNGNHPSAAKAYEAAGYTQRCNGHVAKQSHNTQIALAIAEREKQDKAQGIGKRARELIDNGLKRADRLPPDVQVGMGVKLLEIADKLGADDRIDDLSRLALEVKLRRAYRTGLRQGLHHRDRAKLHLYKLERLLPANGTKGESTITSGNSPQVTETKAVTVDIPS